MEERFRGPDSPDFVERFHFSSPIFTHKAFSSRHACPYASAINKMPPNSKEARKHSATLTRLLKARPAPIREAALLEAAFGTTKPVKPPAGECCGSSCDPCVMDLYAQELKVWKECAAYREIVYEDADASMKAENLKSSSTSEETRKMPGAFEW